MHIASEQIRAIFDGSGIDDRVRGRELVLAMRSAAEGAMRESTGATTHFCVNSLAWSA